MRFIVAIIVFFSSHVYGVGFVPTDFWTSMALKQVRPTDERLFTDPVFSIIEQRYRDFSAHIPLQDVVDDSAPPKEDSIPPVIHFIWLGSDLPSEATISVESWKTHNPDWSVKIWKDADVEGFRWTTERTKRSFYAAKNYAEKADILRYEILYQFGGFYSDTDVICLQPFHDLIRSNAQFVAGVEVNWVSKITKNPLHVGTAIMGSAKGSRVMKYCLDHHIGFDESPDEHILNRTGPGGL